MDSINVVVIVIDLVNEIVIDISDRTMLVMKNSDLTISTNVRRYQTVFVCFVFLVKKSVQHLSEKTQFPGLLLPKYCRCIT